MTNRCIATCAAFIIPLVGCTGPLRPIFPAVVPSIVWPRPPDHPRIQYVGQLLGESSLGRKPEGLAALGALFTGPPPVVDFATPMAVAVEGSTVYVADPGCLAGPCVHVLDLNSRSYRRIAEVGGAPLQRPIDVAVTRGTLAIADALRGVVALCDTAGRAQRIIGQGLLRRPASVAWQHAASELWVVDSAAHGVLVLDSTGTQKMQFGGRGGDAGRFNYPAGLCLLGAIGIGTMSDGTQPAAAVADSMNFRIQLFNDAGAACGEFGKKGDAAGDFSLPRDVATDSKGHIYVLDSQFENVQIFDRDGRLLLAFGQEGKGPGQFSLPSGITIDESDRIWIADTYNRRVQVFQFIPEDRE